MSYTCHTHAHTHPYPGVENCCYHCRRCCCCCCDKGFFAVFFSLSQSNESIGKKKFFELKKNAICQLLLLIFLMDFSDYSFFYFEIKWQNFKCPLIIFAPVFSFFIRWWFIKLFQFFFRSTIFILNFNISFIHSINQSNIVDNNNNNNNSLFAWHFPLSLSLAYHITYSIISIKAIVVVVVVAK